MSVAVLGTVCLYACSSKPVDLTPATADTPPATVASVTPAARTPVTRAVARAAMPPHLDKSHPITDKRSIYFDLDDYVLPPEAVALLQLHGLYLAQHPELAVRIEGHTDELGGSEYNLALGQKRANSVANALRLMGADESQVESISFGKEKPLATGHDEDAWAQNRRADLVYYEK